MAKRAAKKRVKFQKNFVWIKDTFSIIKKHPKNALFIALFDILFIVSLLAIASFFKILIPSPATMQAVFPNITLLFIAAAIISLIYIILLILIYTFFKFMILQFLHELHRSAKLIKNGFWKLFGVNVIITIIFSIVFFASNFLVRILNPNILNVFAVTFLILFLLILYSTVMITHSLFTKKKGLKSLKEGFNVVFRKIPKYIHVYLLSLAGLVIFYIIYYIVGSIFVKSMDPFAFQQTFIPVVGSITLVVVYVLHFLTRIAFFEIFSK